jgi:hypothetical protein
MMNVLKRMHIACPCEAKKRKSEQENEKPRKKRPGPAYLVDDITQESL